MSNPDAPIWRFSSGVTPYRDFDDTSNIPIPISHPLFLNTENVISLDFPIWFNINNRNIMMVSQDPLPRSGWYNDCRDAVCSTCFGMHNPTWRANGIGGKRMWTLVQSLVNAGIGIYITDCKKYYIRTVDNKHIEETQEQLSAYSSMLKAEIQAINPRAIVAFGKKAAVSLSQLNVTDSIPILELPHFSGQAQGKIREFFGVDSEKPFSVDDQTKMYTNVILKEIGE